MIFFKSRHSDLHIKDAKLAYLLVLLRQLDQFTHELDAVPEPELSDIVSAAIRVSGFVEPGEAHQVIAAVLDALETASPIHQRLPFALNSAPPS